MVKKSGVLILLYLLPFVGAAAAEPEPYAMPRTQVIPIQDGKTDRQYELYIKLPEEYSEKTDVTYPVIYTTDAVWHMDMLSGSTEYLMPNVILVGVSWQKNLEGEVAHASRFRDYTVTKFSDPETQARYQGGNASSHLTFIRDDVIKYVENNFRADLGVRAYFSYSLGAVFGAYALLAAPDTFSHYIFGSPALGQQSAEYIDQLEAQTAPRLQDLDARVFVSIGELEESQLNLTRDFVSVLQRRSQAGLELTGLEIIEDSNHGTAFPETVIRSIKWLAMLSSE